MFPKKKRRNTWFLQWACFLHIQAKLRQKNRSKKEKKKERETKGPKSMTCSCYFCILLCVTNTEQFQQTLLPSRVFFLLDVLPDSCREHMVFFRFFFLLKKIKFETPFGKFPIAENLLQIIWFSKQTHLGKKDARVVFKCYYCSKEMRTKCILNKRRTKKWVKHEPLGYWTMPHLQTNRIV